MEYLPVIDIDDSIESQVAVDQQEAGEHFQDDRIAVVMDGEEVTEKTRAVKVLAVTQRQAVLNAMPGTANQIAERTGTNVNAVWHHIYSLRDSGEVEKAGRIRTPTPAARFRTAVVYGKVGELPELPPLGPVERAKARPRPGRKKKPTNPPHTAEKTWVIDSPYRTIFAGPHPYGGSER